MGGGQSQVERRRMGLTPGPKLAAGGGSNPVFLGRPLSGPAEPGGGTGPGGPTDVPGVMGYGASPSMLSTWLAQNPKNKTFLGG